MKNVVCLMSGGIDSTIGLEYIRRNYKNKNIIPLYIDLDTKYTSDELIVVRKLERLMKFKLKVVYDIGLGGFESGKNSFISGYFVISFSNQSLNFILFNSKAIAFLKHELQFPQLFPSIGE